MRSTRRSVPFALTLALPLLLLTTGCDKKSSAEETSAGPPKRSAAGKGSGERPGKGPGKGRPDFASLDGNGDGKLVEGEVPADQWARLVKADSDGDDAVSKEELAAHRPPRPKR